MDGTESELLYVTVDLWHPDCWTLRTTRDADAGVLGRRTAQTGDGATGQFEVYGESGAAVDALVEAIRDCPLTEAVTDLSPAAGPGRADGPATTPVLVEFDPAPSVRSAFAERGFLHHGPTRHEGGRERRSLIVRADRPALRRSLDRIEAEYDADVDLVEVRSLPRGSARRPERRLSPRQREALRLARERGYYEYPRGTTARDLAAELGVSKTTFLEHLRKAEGKILAGVDL